MTGSLVSNIPVLRAPWFGAVLSLSGGEPNNDHLSDVAVLDGNLRQLAVDLDKLIAAKDGEAESTVVTDELARMESAGSYSQQAKVERLAAILECIEADDAASAAVRQSGGISFGSWVLRTAGEHPLVAVTPLTVGTVLDRFAAENEVRERMRVSKEAWEKHNLR